MSAEGQQSLDSMILMQLLVGAMGKKDKITPNTPFCLAQENIGSGRPNMSTP